MVLCKTRFSNGGKKMCLTFQYSFSYWNSIADIIEHYRKEQIVEGYYLKDPVPMQVGFHL